LGWGIIKYYDVSEMDKDIIMALAHNWIIQAACFRKQWLQGKLMMKDGILNLVEDFLIGIMDK
jgi:hypothetical protein